MTKPNIIFIITDQQRFDTINAAGYEHVITPNLDKLYKGSLAFKQAYCPAATCVATRAAVFTGMYPHNTGVYGFKNWSHHSSWVQDLADHGYHCVNLGKMHIMPIYENIGFHERRVVENKTLPFLKNHRADDEWGNFLHHHGLARPMDRHITDEGWLDKYQAVDWEYDERFHSDSFVGDLTLSWLEKWDQYKPLFLEIGFPGPHDPYDPPSRFLDLYKNIEMPDPIYKEGELDQKPPQQKGHREAFKSRTTHESKIDIEKATNSDIKRMRKYYCANITLIDEKIGEIINMLKNKGMLENTVFIFTSDHGDNLGDHKLPYKWLMYDTVTRVPLLIKDFRKDDRFTPIHDLVSLIDIGPTILDIAGCQIPVYIEGRSLVDYLESGKTDNPYQYIFAEDNYLMMIRSKDYKLVYYIDQPYGELYDLHQDPWELNNLWDIGKFQAVKLQLKENLLSWLSKSNYFNAGYKQTHSKEYEMIWPRDNNFSLIAQYSHLSISQKTLPKW